MLLYTLFFSAVAIIKHYTFLTLGFDLSIFDQAFWSTLFKQRLFYETGDLSFNPGGSFFGVHFSPILFILLPFYAIYPSAETLLVMHSAILALGLVPIYWMARERLGKKFALTFALLYLVYPALSYLNFNDFHLESFASPFLLFAVYYLEHEQWGKYFTFLVLSLSTLEFVPVITVFIALYGFLLYFKKIFKNENKALICFSITLLLSFSWFILAQETKSFFNPATSPMPTPWQHIIENPFSLFSTLSEDLSSKIWYIVAFLGPLGFIPLLAPAPLLMALPWFLSSFVARYPPYYLIYYHYNGFVIPFVFTAFIKGVEKLNSIKFGHLKTLYASIFCATVIVSLLLPVMPNCPWTHQLPEPNERTGLIYDVLSLIPKDASILTENDFAPHLSNRLNLYMYPPQQSNFTVDYILGDTSSIWYNWVQHSSFGERLPMNETLSSALMSGEYGILASAKGILLLKRGYVGEPVIFVPYSAEYDYRTLIVDKGRVISDSSSVTGKVLYHSADDGVGTFCQGSFTILPPGLYEATFTIKINSNSSYQPEEHILALNIYNSTNGSFLANKYVYGNDAPGAGQWFNISVMFGLDNVANNISFSIFVANENCDIYLDRVLLNQVDPTPSQS
jgi:uncharacterized membrane protein